jgi:hypothetical protein
LKEFQKYTQELESKLKKLEGKPALDQIKEMKTKEVQVDFKNQDLELIQKELELN